MIHLMMLIRYCIVSFRTSVSPKLSDLVHLYYTSFVSNCQENIMTKKHKSSAPVSGCGQTVDKKHSHRSKRRGVNAFFKQEQTFAQKIEKAVKKQAGEEDFLFHLANFFKFTHTKVSVTCIVTFARPRSCVKRNPRFTFASANTRSIFCLRWSYRSFTQGIWRYPDWC